MDKTKLPIALSLTAILIAIVGLVISIKERDVGRYQLCAATIVNVNINPATPEAPPSKEPKLFKIDTQTGETWEYLSISGSSEKSSSRGFVSAPQLKTTPK